MNQQYSGYHQLQGPQQPPNMNTNVIYNAGPSLNAINVQPAGGAVSAGPARPNFVVSPHALGVLNYPSAAVNRPMSGAMPSPAYGPILTGLNITQSPNVNQQGFNPNPIVISPKNNAPLSRPLPSSNAVASPINFTTRPTAVPFTNQTAAPRPVPVPVPTVQPGSAKQILTVPNVNPEALPQLQQDIMHIIKTEGKISLEQIGKLSERYRVNLHESYISGGAPKPKAPPAVSAAPGKYVAGPTPHNITLDRQSNAIPPTVRVIASGDKPGAEKPASPEKKEKRKKQGIEWSLREKIQLKKAIVKYGTAFNEMVSHFPGRNASSLRKFYFSVGGAKGFYKPNLSAHSRLKRANELDSYSVALTPEELAAIENNETVTVVPEELEPQSSQVKSEDEPEEDRSESSLEEREIKVEDPYAGLTDEQKREKIKERAELIFQANKRGIYWGSSLENIAPAPEPDRKRKFTMGDDTAAKKRRQLVKSEAIKPLVPSDKKKSPGVISASRLASSSTLFGDEKPSDKKVFSFGPLPKRSLDYYTSPASSLTDLAVTFKSPKFAVTAPKQAVKPGVKQPPSTLIKKAVPVPPKGLNLNDLKKSTASAKAQQEPQKKPKARPVGVKASEAQELKQMQTIMHEAFVSLLHKQADRPLEQTVLRSNCSAAMIDHRHVVTGIVRHVTEKEEEDQAIAYQAIEVCKSKFKFNTTKEHTSCLLRERSGPQSWEESTLFPIDAVHALTPFDTSIIAIGTRNEVHIYDVSESGEGRQLMKLLGHSNRVIALHFSSKGHLASVDESGMIRIWQYQQLRRPKPGPNKQLVYQITNAYQSLKDTSSVSLLHWSQHSEVLLSVSNATIKVWDMVTGSIRPKYAIETPSRVNCVALKAKVVEERSSRWLVVAPITTVERQGSEPSCLLIYDMVRDRTTPTRFDLPNTTEVSAVALNPAASQFCYVLQATNTTKPQLHILSVTVPVDGTSVGPSQTAAKPVVAVLQCYEYSPLHECFELVGTESASTDAMEDVTPLTYIGGDMSVNTQGNLLVVTLVGESGENKSIVFSLIENSKLEAIYG